MHCRCKQAEILAGVCGQREALERKVYEQDVQMELSLDDLESTVQVTSQNQALQQAFALVSCIFSPFAFVSLLLMSLVCGVSQYHLNAIDFLTPFGLANVRRDGRRQQPCGSMLLKDAGDTQTTAGGTVTTHPVRMQHALLTRMHHVLPLHLHEASLHTLYKLPWQLQLRTYTIVNVGRISTACDTAKTQQDLAR